MINLRSPTLLYSNASSRDEPWVLIVMIPEAYCSCTVKIYDISARGSKMSSANLRLSLQ